MAFEMKMQNMGKCILSVHQCNKFLLYTVFSLGRAAGRISATKIAPAATRNL